MNGTTLPSLNIISSINIIDGLVVLNMQLSLAYLNRKKKKVTVKADSYLHMNTSGSLCLVQAGQDRVLHRG